jgi:hypothetical protein
LFSQATNIVRTQQRTGPNYHRAVGLLLSSPKHLILYENFGIKRLKEYHSDILQQVISGEEFLNCLRGYDSGFASRVIVNARRDSRKGYRA